MNQHPGLTKMTFKELFESETLPSGHPFVLMDDTVDIALKVAEVSDAHVWRKKAMQAFVVTKSVGGVELHSDGDEGGGVEFLHNMLDLDVVFLSLAWTAQLNGMSVKLEEGVPCPSCTHLFHEVPFGDLVINSRTRSEASGFVPVEGIPDEQLPRSIRGKKLFVKDPTWQAARQFVAERSWSNTDVVSIYRTMSSLYAEAGDKNSPPRALSMQGEAKKMSTRALNTCTDVLEKHIPNFQMHLDLKCKKCKEISVIPFGEGV